MVFAPLAALTLIEGYIVDFVCLEQCLIIEADGKHHHLQQEYDQTRTNIFSAAGYRVLRFWNNEILENFESVLEKIRLAFSNPLLLRAVVSGEHPVVILLSPLPP
jgi:very-short-patch-repair endonuclease